MAMIDDVKLALRIKSDGLDADIELNIDACYRDLSRTGIAVYNPDGTVKSNIASDPLIKACQILYCRWQFNFEEEADRYERTYKDTRNGLALCGEYNA